MKDPDPKTKVNTSMFFRINFYRCTLENKHGKNIIVQKLSLVSYKVILLTVQCTFDIKSIEVVS